MNSQSLRFKVGFSAVVLLVLVGGVELVFRLARYDFKHQARAMRETPIYYRQPLQPVGPIFFKRPGPARWSGQVLNAAYPRDIGLPSPYAGEAPVTVVYDADGFRNDPPLLENDIVFVGDSFLELGYLPQEDLYTSVIARELNLKVKNLGVSYTGPLSHIFMFKEYGRSPRTRDAVMVFFEGNDLFDLSRERAALDKLQRTGVRKYREIKPQSSVIIAVRDLARSFIRGAASGRADNGHGLPDGGEKPADGSHAPANGFPLSRFKSRTGFMDTKLDYVPVSSSDLTAEEKASLGAALDSWAETCRSGGVRPWLVFMPAKRRVLHGFVDNPHDHPDWRPTDLPVYIAGVCARRDIQFVDLTPGLVAKTGEGVLTYNPTWDTHLTRAGSGAVAETFVREWRRRHSPGPDGSR